MSGGGANAARGLYRCRSDARYAVAVPNVVPTHVLTKRAVRWGIDTLGARRVHPTFVPYLYLRMHARAGTLASASASSAELLALIDMPGNALKPYYFPLISRGRRRPGELLHTFWRAPNIPGTWSPASIHRQAVGSWLANEAGEYVMPDNHSELARRQMLYDSPVSAWAMGAYFLRNDGFVLEGEPTAEDLVSAFRTRFDFLASTGHEFVRLYTDEVPEVDFPWFEPADSLADPGSEEASDV
jgi:hypothetical protein